MNNKTHFLFLYLHYLCFFVVAAAIIRPAEETAVNLLGLVHNCCEALWNIVERSRKTPVVLRVSFQVFQIFC